MPRRLPPLALLAFAFVIAGAPPRAAAQADTPAAGRTPRPATGTPAPAGTGTPARAAGPGAAARAAGLDTATRLVVLLLVDQLRPDYLDRLAPRFGPDGFRRLIREGVRFTECAYPYALTETGPGHATLATGTTPDRHGIVSNDWYDPATKKVVAAVDDPDFPLVGAPGNGVSPRRLAVDTIGDALRLATRGAARVWSIAGKDRSAVFGAGRGANGAVWYDIHSGLFITSRYYMDALPSWAAGVNAGHPSDRLLKETGEKNYDDLRGTVPFHDLMFEAARQLVTAEHLGEDAVPDLLVVGLSGVDILGHEVGPYDPGLEQMVVRLDAQIGAFLRFLDERAGAGRTLVALSADHGVGPTFEQARAAGLHPERIDRARLAGAMSAALASRAGSRPAPRAHGDTPLEIWFDPQELDQSGLSRDEAARLAGEAAVAVAGIHGYFTRSRTSLDPALAETYRLSSFEGRSPDLFLVPDPYAVDPEGSPATHGSPWSYDRRVPLILAGPPFRHEVDSRECSPADLAPTIAAALGIPPPAGATGRPLQRGAKIVGASRPTR